MLNPPIKCHCELETKGTGVEERTLLGDDPKMHKNKGDFAEVNPCLLHPRDFLGMWSPPAHPHPYHGHWCQACLLQPGLHSLGHITDVGQCKLTEELWAKMPCMGLKELQCLQLQGGENK